MARTRARDRRGRFVKRSSTTTALARRSTSAPRVVTRTRTVAVAAPRRRRRSVGGGSSSSGMMWRVGTSMAWGWAKNRQAATLARVPRLEAVGLEGTLAIAGYFFGPKIGGGPTVRRAVRELTDTWATLAAYQFGRTEGTSWSIDGDDLDDLAGPLDMDVDDVDEGEG